MVNNPKNQIKLDSGQSHFRFDTQELGGLMFSRLYLSMN